MTINDASSMIEDTLRRINDQWASGCLHWMSAERLKSFKRMKILETSINKAVEAEDTLGLGRLLTQYENLLLKTVYEFRRIYGKDRC